MNVLKLTRLSAGTVASASPTVIQYKKSRDSLCVHGKQHCDRSNVATVADEAHLLGKG